MILYLSAGTEKEFFRQCQEKGYINGGYQAQKFNQMIIEGLAMQTNVTAISNPPFALGLQNKILAERICNDDTTYISLGNNPGKLHRILNIVHMLKNGMKVCKDYPVRAIVCDAINPLASLTCGILHLLYRIPQVAIVTDIPGIMSEGKDSFFSRLASFLLKRYQGYVLLTEAMNSLVNPTHQPYIIMEGLCDVKEMEQMQHTTKKTICLYSGSLFPNTGIENLIYGFREKNIEDYQLHIYGNGPLVETLCKTNDDNVKYCGVLTNQEIVSRQKEAKLLINPRPISLRYAEYSFPSKIMEYMVSGTPVLSTKLAGIPEEYRPYMYWIDDDSKEGIATAIQEVLSIPENVRDTKGHDARKFVLEKKNNIYQTKRILDLIERIRR